MTEFVCVSTGVAPYLPNWCLVFTISLHRKRQLIKMALTYSNSLTRVVVSKICQDVGWQTAHVSTLDALSELLVYYIRQVSTAALDYANHCGRAQPTFDDLAMAFNYLSIDMSQLQDFILNIDSSPLSIPIPLYPLPCRQNRVFDNYEQNQDRPE